MGENDTNAESEPCKVEPVAVVQQMYFVSKTAAQYILDYHAFYRKMELGLKQMLEKREIPKEYGASHIELENALACCNDIEERIAGFVADACHALRRNYPALDVPTDGVIKHEFERHRNLQEFYEQYTEARVLYKQRQNAQNPAEENSDDNEDLGETLADYYEMAYNTTEGVEKLDELKFKAIKAGIEDFIERQCIGVDTLMQEFPENVRDDISGKIRMCMIERILAYAGGEYVHGLEYEYLSSLEENPGPQHDDLYDRLEREQQLSKDDMQRVYLARFVELKRVTNADLFDEAIKRDQFSLDTNEKKLHGSQEYLREQTKLDFVKDCGHKHRAWLERFLNN